MLKPSNSIVIRVYGMLNHAERAKAFSLILLLLLGVVAEAFSLGLFVPMVAITLDVPSNEASAFMNFLQPLIGNSAGENSVMRICLLLMAVFILKNLFLLFLACFQTSFVFDVQVRLARDLLSSYLHKPYDFFFSRNSATLLRNVTGSVPEVVVGILMNMLYVFSDLMVTIAIASVLIFMEPSITLSVLFFFIIPTLFFYRWVRSLMNRYGKQYNHYLAELVRWVNQSIGGIQEIRILGKENACLTYFVQACKLHVQGRKYYTVANMIPRLYIETALVAGMLSMVVFFAFSNRDLRTLVPTLALFSMAAFRLLPATTRMMSCLTSIKFSLPALDNIYEELLEVQKTCAEVAADPADDPPEEYSFQSLQLEKVTFCYPSKAEPVLTNLDLEINSGKTVGIIGPSGVGKTTLIYIMLGLLAPSSGVTRINGVSHKLTTRYWQRKIGYIPQRIYLCDDTIAGNVALGVLRQDIDETQLWKVLEMAQIADYVKTLPQGIDTVVGEQGITLSGGQRQRLGIARALYHDPAVLILDEATSALDTETEKQITSALEKIHAEKAVIIVAHRLSTLAICDSIYEVKGGGLWLCNKEDALKNISVQNHEGYGEALTNEGEEKLG